MKSISFLLCAIIIMLASMDRGENLYVEIDKKSIQQGAELR